MIVRCSNCQTEFSLDDRQLADDGAAVRCTVCRYVFRVEPVGGPSGDQPWQIRTVEDLLFTAPDLTTLRTWITEGRLHPDDHVSRTGKHWLRLGDMPEFADAFAGFRELPGVLAPVTPGAASLGPPPAFGAVGPTAPDDMTDSAEIVDESEEAPTVANAKVKIPSEVSEEEPTVARFAPVPPPRPRPTPPPVPVLDLEPDADSDDDGEADAPRRRPTAIGMPTPPPVPSPSGLSVAAEPPREAKKKRRIETAKVMTVQAAQRAGLIPEEGAQDADVITRVLDEEDDPPLPAGVPAGVPEEVSDDDGSKPASLLDAVTSHVKPITHPAVETDHRHDVVPSESVQERAIAGRTAPVSDGRRSMWPIVAVLGVLAGVAVIFGVPPIREKVMTWAGVVAGEPKGQVADLKELSAVGDALAKADPRELGKAEAALQGRLDGGGLNPATVATARVAQVELLATRALLSRLEAASDAERADAATSAAKEDTDRAGRIFDDTDVGDVPDRDRVRIARARLRLAQGRPAVEIHGLLPEGGAAEVRVLIDAAPLWTDATSAVPDGLLGRLRDIAEPTGLAQLVLAMAYARSGDEDGARGVVEELLSRDPTRPVALAMRNSFGVAAKPTTAGDEAGAAEGAAAEGAADEAGEPETADEAGGDEGAAAEAGEEPIVVKDPVKPTGGGGGVNRMIDRGCDLIEKGQAMEGVAILRKAVEKKPNNMDVLICMGEGHMKLRTFGTALRYYERALGRNPNYPAALRGAARASAKAGQTKKAVKYYKRVLAGEPRNGEAKRYIAEHDKTGEQPKDPPSGG